MSKELIDGCDSPTQPIVVDSDTLEAIIDALMASETREVSFAVEGKPMLTLCVEKITAGSGI